MSRPVYTDVTRPAYSSGALMPIRHVDSSIMNDAQKTIDSLKDEIAIAKAETETRTVSKTSHPSLLTEKVTMNITLKSKEWDKMLTWARHATQKYKSEIGGLLLGKINEKTNGVEITRAALIDCVVSHSEVEIDDDKLTAYLCRPNIAPHVIGWWHSHNDFSPFMSATDNETTEMLLGSLDTCVSIVINSFGSYYPVIFKKIPHLNSYIKIPATVYVARPQVGRKEWTQEVDRKLKERTSTFTQNNTSYGSYTTVWCPVQKQHIWNDDFIYTKEDQKSAYLRLMDKNATSIVKCLSGDAYPKYDVSVGVAKELNDNNCWMGPSDSKSIIDSYIDFFIKEIPKKFEVDIEFLTRMKEKPTLYEYETDRINFYIALFSEEFEDYSEAFFKVFQHSSRLDIYKKDKETKKKEEDEVIPPAPIDDSFRDGVMC